MIINSLENKSTGPSSIPLRMLSIIPDLIILPLAHIIKMSIVTGVYPDLLKIVKGHKGGSIQFNPNVSQQCKQYIYTIYNVNNTIYTIYNVNNTYIQYTM